MNTLAVAIIAAGAAIVSAIITGVFSFRKIDKDLAIHEEKSGRRGDGSSNEHTNLSNAISYIGGDLSREHKDLAKEIATGTQVVSGLATDVRVLREEQIKTSERQSALTSQQLDIQKTVEHITALSSEVARLQAENQSLRQQVADLQGQYSRLCEPLSQKDSPQHDDDWDLEQ